LRCYPVWDLIEYTQGLKHRKLVISILSERLPCSESDWIHARLKHWDLWSNHFWDVILFGIWMNNIGSFPWHNFIFDVTVWISITTQTESHFPQN
jgi:hypothetical protein